VFVTGYEGYREALITAAVNGEIDMYTFDHEQHLERTVR